MTLQPAATTTAMCTADGREGLAWFGVILVPHPQWLHQRLLQQKLIYLHGLNHWRMLMQRIGLYIVSLVTNYSWNLSLNCTGGPV